MKSIFRSLYWLACLVTLGQWSLSANVFRGQVRDDLTNLPIEGAVVEMRLNPASETPDIVVLADPFGMFETDQAAASASYSVKVTHPAYDEENEVIVIDTTRKTQNYRLTPRADLPGGGPGVKVFDLYVQVACTTTYLELRDLPVTVKQFADATSGTPLRTQTVQTDANGFAVVRGWAAGHYEFEVNTVGAPGHLSGWESVPSAGSPAVRRFLDQTHALNVLLKPVEQSLTFLVQGYDYVKNSPDPFDFNGVPEPLGRILVELTGFDPIDPERILLPVVSDVTNFTDAPGMVSFPQLPGIAYEVTVKALGYYNRTFFITPDASGLLPNELQVVDIQAEPHDLTLRFAFDDYLPNTCSFEFFGIFLPEGDRFAANSLNALEVILQGLAGTSTEGMERRGIHEFNTSVCATSTYFLDGYVKPGRYKVTLRGIIESGLAWEDTHGTRSASGISFPVLQEEFIEIHSDGPEGVVLQPFDTIFNSRTIHVKTRPEHVLGRLWQADTAEVPGITISRFTNPTPVYQPLARQTLIFHQPANLDIFGNFTPITVMTDDEGYFELDLLPGVYAVEAPGLEGSFGERYVYEVRSTDGGREIGDRILGSWPIFEEWPDRSDNYPFYPGRGGLHGLAINGGDAPLLHLYLRKERYFLNLSASTSGPTDLQAIFVDRFEIDFAPYYHLANSNALATAQGMFDTFEAPFRVGPLVGLGDGRNYAVYAVFQDLPPDTYSFPLVNEDYDFPNLGSVAPITLHDFPAPGRAPTLGLLTAVNSNPSLVIPLGIAQRTVQAEEKAVPISIQSFQWTLISTNPDTYEYRPTSTSLLGVYVAPGYVDGFFDASNEEVPATGASLYVTNPFDSTVICLVPNGGQVYFGGPSATPTVAFPAVVHDLEIIACTDTNPNLPVAGVKLIVGITDPQTITTLNGPLLLSNRTDSAYLEDDFSDNFILRSTSHSVVTGGIRPRVILKAEVERAVQLRATVTNAQTGNPIPEVTVRFLNAYGAETVDTFPSPQGRTDANGKVNFSQQRLRNHFIEVRHPGYQIFRQRLPVSELVEIDGALIHEVAVALIPLPGPAFAPTGVPFNRFGGFLPGVTRSGDASSFELYSARDTLTATWEVTLTRQSIDYQIPAFDQADGSVAPPERVSYLDSLTKVFLVDRRQFEKSGFRGNDTPLNIPNVDSPHLLQDILRKIQSGTLADPQEVKTTVYLQTAETLAPVDGEPDKVKATGRLPLWELPAGDFQPAFIAVSGNGAYGVLPIDYEGPMEEEKRLTGIAIPPWLGFAFDLLGLAAGIGATQDEISKYVPLGRIIPVPEFTASIAEAEDEEGQSTGYIDYEYSIETEETIGQESPSGGEGGFFPQLFGAKVSSNASITAKGEDRALTLAFESLITKEEIDASAYVPNIAAKVGAEVELSNISGGINSQFISNADTNKPYELRIQHSIGLNLDAKATMNLTTVTGKIPYAGPVLLLLDKTGLLVTTAFVSTGIGFASNFCWQTLRPEDNTFQSTTDPDPRSRRRHFLGGDEIDEDQAPMDEEDPCAISHNFCFRLGAGVTAEAKALGFALGGELSLNLAGPECGVPAAESLTFTFNNFGDYPVIKRIQGQINLNLNTTVQTPISKSEKEYSWNLLQFDAQYGTETVLQLVPMGIVYEEERQSDLEFNELTGNGPALLVQTSSLMHFSATQGAADAALATVYNPSTGQVELRLLPRNGHLSYDASILVAASAVIGVHAVHRLPDGRIVVAWAEPIFGVDPFDPLATQYIRYAVSDAQGSNFSAPQVAVFLSGVAASLQMVQSGPNLFLHTQMVIGSLNAPIHQFIGQTFDSASGVFNAAVFLGQDTAGANELQILGAGPSGAGEMALIFLNNLNELRALRWDGVNLGFVSTIDSGLASGLAGLATTAGYQLLAATADGTLKRYTAGVGVNAPFSPAGGTLPAVSPLEAQIVSQDVSPTGGLLYVFTKKTLDGSRICYLYFDGQQTPDPLGARELTNNDQGFYSRLRLSRVDGDTAYVYALFENSPPEVRTFAISLSNGLSANDSDGDGVNDLGELLIVDANSIDSIFGVADVLGSDDYDLDGFDNATEISLGSHPADPFSTPETGDLPIVTIAASVPEAREDGLVAGNFALTRSGEVDSSLQVKVQATGTAVAGVDYQAIGSSIEIPASASSTNIPVTPLPDNLAEGSESVVLTILPDGAYLVGGQSMATVSLQDLPVDAWRHLFFGIQANDPTASDLADPDFDGIANLLEYALALDPNVAERVGLPTIHLVENQPTGEFFLALQYTESGQASDLAYIVEVSPDLSLNSWRSGVGYVIEVSRTPDGQGNTTVLVRNTVPLGTSGPGFIRLRVTRN